MMSDLTAPSVSADIAIISEDMMSQITDADFDAFVERENHDEFAENIFIKSGSESTASHIYQSPDQWNYDFDLSEDLSEVSEVLIYI